MTLDLKNLRVADAAERVTRTELENPFTGEPLLDDEGSPFYVEHLGEDCEVVRRLERKFADRRSEKLRRGAGANLLTQEVLQAERAEKLAAATRSWYLPPNDGQTIEFNPINARELYRDPNTSWIGDQVSKSMQDLSRFLPKA